MSALWPNIFQHTYGFPTLPIPPIMRANKSLKFTFGKAYPIHLLYIYIYWAIVRTKNSWTANRPYRFIYIIKVRLSPNFKEVEQHRCGRRFICRFMGFAFFFFATLASDFRFPNWKCTPCPYSTARNPPHNCIVIARADGDFLESSNGARFSDAKTFLGFIKYGLNSKTRCSRSGRLDFGWSLRPLLSWILNVAFDHWRGPFGRFSVSNISCMFNLLF